MRITVDLLSAIGLSLVLFWNLLHYQWGKLSALDYVKSAREQAGFLKGV